MTLKEILASVDRKKARLDECRPLSASQAGSLKTFFDVDFTFNSTAIEGNTLTIQETRIVLLDGMTIGGKSVREHLEILNHKEAIDYIESLAARKISGMTRSDILNLHSIVLRGIDSAHAGTYRDVPVYIRKADGRIHKFCDPVHVNDEMEAFVAWLGSPEDLHPVWLAAEVHTRFVSIHPFVDGNGRTARLLMNLVLLQAGYVPCVIPVARRNHYLDAIEEWQDGGNKELLVGMIAAAVDESLDIWLETIEKNVLWK